MMKKNIFLAVLIPLLGILISCSKDDNNISPKDNIPVNSILLKDKTVSLVPGESLNIGDYISGLNDSIKVEIRAKSQELVKIEDYTITALKVGETIIEIDIADNKFNFTLTIEDKIKGYIIFPIYTQTFYISKDFETDSDNLCYETIFLKDDPELKFEGDAITNGLVKVTKIEGENKIEITVLKAGEGTFKAIDNTNNIESNEIMIKVFPSAEEYIKATIIKSKYGQQTLFPYMGRVPKDENKYMEFLQKVEKLIGRPGTVTEKNGAFYVELPDDEITQPEGFTHFVPEVFDEDGYRKYIYQFDNGFTKTNVLPFFCPIDEEIGSKYSQDFRLAMEKENELKEKYCKEFLSEEIFDFFVSDKAYFLQNKITNDFYRFDIDFWNRSVRDNRDKKKIIYITYYGFIVKLTHEVNSESWGAFYKVMLDKYLRGHSEMPVTRANLIRSKYDINY